MSDIDQVAGSVGAFLASRFLDKKSREYYMSKSMTPFAQKDSIGLSKELIRHLGDNGIPVYKFVGTGLPQAFAFSGTDPSTKKSTIGIALDSRIRNTGVLVHEAGHALFQKPILSTNPDGTRTLVNKIYTINRRASKPISLLSALGVAASPDKDVSRNIALAGVAARSLDLATELHASYKGSKLLNDLAKKVNGKNLPFLKRLYPFSGIPTYAISSSLPLITYKLKDLFNGFRKDTKQ